MKKITFTVTNDLIYDQRMQRICTSVANAGYDVLLIGRKLKGSSQLKKEAYKQHRIVCLFTKGKFFYLEFNLRLLILLLLEPAHCYCAIDLDTILPNLFVSHLTNRARVYDAHELFTEQKEIVTRPFIYKLWLRVEKFAVPKFEYGYTVNNFIADEFKKRYRVNYCVVRNLPRLSNIKHSPDLKNRFIIYQGAVNEGRSFETLIPAMKLVDAKLVICGNGNFYNQAVELVKLNKVEEKVMLRGMVAPDELKALTPTAYIAVMLFEGIGLNQYQSLANRFFDYIMAGVPQICVNYPQYKAINDKYEVACLINNTEPETIAHALNNLMDNAVYYQRLHNNCLLARKELNWESEEKILTSFYNSLFSL